VQGNAPTEQHAAAESMACKLRERNLEIFEREEVHVKGRDRKG
jgi:hypothetical protein